MRSLFCIACFILSGCGLYNASPLAAAKVGDACDLSSIGEACDEGTVCSFGAACELETDAFSNCFAASQLGAPSGDRNIVGMPSFSDEGVDGSGRPVTRFSIIVRDDESSTAPPIDPNEIIYFERNEDGSIEDVFANEAVPLFECESVLVQPAGRCSADLIEVNGEQEFATSIKIINDDLDREFKDLAFQLVGFDGRSISNAVCLFDDAENQDSAF